MNEPTWKNPYLLISFADGVPECDASFHGTEEAAKKEGLERRGYSSRPYYVFDLKGIIDIIFTEQHP